MQKFDLIIIGAGVSGCFCAINKKDNIKTLLIDSNDCILKKFMITGKGKSNIANTSKIEIFIKNIIDSNKFIYPSLIRHNGNNIIEFLDEIGIKYYEKEPNRFHLQESNNNFRKKIIDILNKKEINITLNEQVIDVIKKDDHFVIETKNKKKFISNKLVIATGGKSFSKLGCKGFGYDIGKKFNHKIEQLYPIGVGLHINDEKMKVLQGISFDNVKATVFWENKVKYSEVGSIMFSHYGLGGPLIRRISGYVTKYLQNHNSCKIKICYIDKKIVEDEINNNKQLNACFRNYNKSVIKFLLRDFKNHNDLCNLKKEIKNQIINAITNVEYEINSFEPIEQAINTGGGINLKNIDPNTMESKLVNGLYFIGEVLDINPRTNGYNITVCYSTANSCIDDINHKL